MLLALALSLSLLPVTALAADPCDVYQGDGFYITATPYKLNSTKYRLPASNGSTLAGNLQFYDGLVMVYNDTESDENYVNRKYVYELNWADRDGNIVLPEGSLKANDRVYDLSRFHHFDVSEGILAYWDGESKNGSSALYGFMDTKGNILTPCLYSISGLLSFKDGVNVVYNEVSKQRECIDTRGNVLFASSSDTKTKISVFSPYDNGLAPGGIATYDSAGREVKSYGFLDKQGNMALELFSISEPDNPEDKKKDYYQLCAEGKTDGYLIPLKATRHIGGKYGFDSYDGSGGFSEGYAVCCDLRSGNEKDYNFAIIDRSGRVVGTFSDAKPLGDVHDGLLRVEFINNQGGSDGIGFVDVTGKAALRDVPRNDYIGGKRLFNDDFSCGVTWDRSTVVDTKGETVIPNDVFGSGHCPDGFQDNICLAFVGYNRDAYLLEIHQGVYTGPGRVYNHSQGGEVSAAPVQPQQPAAPVQPQQPAGSLAYASTQSVEVDGRNISFQMYALKDASGNPTNYIKLRDVAFALNGTAAQFEVGWDGAVNIQPGLAYTPNGSEMSTPFSGDRAYEPAASETRINAAAASLEAIVLKDDQGGAYTYYKLRDLGRALGFNVGWSGERGIFVETGKPYQG